MSSQKNIMKFGKNIIRKKFDSEPVYTEKYLKAKIKSYNGKIDMNFHNNKMPKKGFQFISRIATHKKRLSHCT